MTRKPQAGWDCSRLSERVLHEPAFARHGPLPAATPWKALFPRLFSKLRHAVRFMVQTGYQDETGFHGGVKPVENRIQWPPVW